MHKSKHINDAKDTSLLSTNPYAVFSPLRTCKKIERVTQCEKDSAKENEDAVAVI